MLFLSNIFIKCVIILVSNFPIFSCSIVALLLITVSLLNDFATTSILIITCSSPFSVNDFCIVPLSFTCTSESVVPSEYIISNLLNCTSSGNLSENIFDSSVIAD